MRKQPSRREQLIASILRAGREESRLSVLFRELIAKRFGIGVTDGECMDFLMEKGSATAGELARITGLTTGAITGVIQRLKRAGLVTAKPDRQDKRRTIVRPWMPKIRAGERLYASFGNSLNKLYGRYTLEELKLLAEYYTRMRDLLSDEIRKLSHHRG
jgi:DNA-binding MarR family transcriptional regulator